MTRSDRRMHPAPLAPMACDWGPTGVRRFVSWKTLAHPCSKRTDGVYSTAWTTIRPPVYSATERLKESDRFSR
ncbi:hypothetical protein A6U87_23895 [Rhizobium sp. AC44/96]|nr:hypothetical protein A6U87_23895 [Rhizobium sp. AC44/96]